jgi:UrcA family protein
MERAARYAQLHTPQADPTAAHSHRSDRQRNTTHQEIAMNTLISVASTAFLSLVLNAAYADEAPKSLTVQFADLDLSKDEGAAALFNRIKGAAKQVCSAQSSGMTLRDKQRHAACIEFALSNAVARVDRPELTEYVISRNSTERKAPVKVASGR